MDLPADQIRRVLEAGNQIAASLPHGNRQQTLSLIAASFASLLGAERCGVYLAGVSGGGLTLAMVHPGDVEAANILPLADPRCQPGAKRTWRLSAADPVGAGLLAEWKTAGLIAESCQTLLLVLLSGRNGQLQGVVVIGNKPGADFVAADELQVELLADITQAALDTHKTFGLLSERLGQRTAELSLANAELARAARLSDQFLANMSHELRTPLNTILGMSQALQEGVMGEINADQASYLQMVEKAGRHLLGMLTDILTLSKIGAGRLEPHLEPVAVQATCQDCMQFIIQPGRQKHIKMDVKCDPQVKMFQADENILKQILVNLLTNAVKFTPERGAVGLEVKGDPARQVIEFIVWDTGHGIALEDMNRMFRPFVQLEENLARLYSGTGLGLSLVYRLAELHGGSVTVESEPHKGSRFTVTLPWTTSTIEEATPAPVPVTDKPLILLVEDNEKTIKTLANSLAANGYRVTVARQGAEALERISEDPPALMLMDLQLAGMDGWALLRHLRSHTRLANIAIIALTALVIPGEREKCLEIGADDYLVKPVAAAELMAATAACLARRQPGSVKENLNLAKAV